jgi:NTP pyrophosphatase (non-canonical NTP hydrolase)
MITKQDEALICLAEECGELIKECMKIIRFGDSSEAIARLEQEAGDVLCLMGWLQKNGVIDFDKVEQASIQKEKKLHIYSNLYGDTSVR